MQTLFSDALLNISVTGNLVRLDLGAMALGQGADNKQDLRMMLVHQIVMPIEGFLKAFNVQEQLIKKLIEDGVLMPEKKPDETSTNS